MRRNRRAGLGKVLQEELLFLLGFLASAADEWFDCTQHRHCLSHHRPGRPAANGDAAARTEETGIAVRDEPAVAVSKGNPDCRAPSQHSTAQHSTAASISERSLVGLMPARSAIIQKVWPGDQCRDAETRQPWPSGNAALGNSQFPVTSVTAAVTGGSTSTPLSQLVVGVRSRGKTSRTTGGQDPASTRGSAATIRQYFCPLSFGRAIDGRAMVSAPALQ